MSRRELWIAAWTLLVTALAKAPALFPGDSPDDYMLLTGPQPDLDHLLRVKGRLGRLGSAFLHWILDALQLDVSHSYFFFGVCFLVATALLATLLVRHWRLDRRLWPAVVMATMITNHPYTVELWTFRAAFGIAVFPTAALCFLLLDRRPTRRRMIAGSVLFAAALSIYQVVLNYAVMALLLGAAVALARYLLVCRRARWRRLASSRLSVGSFLAHANTRLAVSVGAGTLVYAAASALALWALQLARTERAALIGTSQLAARARDVLATLRMRFAEPEALVSPICQALLLGFLLVALVGLFWRSRPFGRPRTVVLSMTIVGLLAAAVVWTVGVLMATEEFWPAPRVVAHVGLFWAAVFGLALAVTGPRLRRILLGAGTLATLSFIGSNNRVLVDQQRLNVRDASRATRIVARLEALPAFPTVQAVAIDGLRWHYEAPFDTVDHDLNISALGAAWSNVPLLSEISGYALPEATEEQQAAAKAYCGGVARWPGRDSVTIRDGLAIVCIEHD